MKEKSLLEVLQDELYKRVASASDIEPRPSTLERVKQTVFGKLSVRLKAIRRHIKANRLLGGFADVDSIRALEYELKYQEDKYEQDTRLREHYFRHIAIGYLDMSEAVLWRCEIFKGEDLTTEVLDTLYNLFNSGKRTLILYSRWLLTIDDDSFIEEWIECFESVHLETFNSFEEWLKFFDTLPA